MYEAKTLAITAYNDEPLPHTFLRQDEEARHVAILLPGWGYNCDLPLLYYPSRLLLTLGADVLRVEYAYQRRADFKALSEPEQERWFFTDVDAACQAVLTQRAYQRITLVGKSIGTLAMGHAVATDARLSDAQAIWLTPLLRDDRVRGEIGQWGGRSLFVIGTADSQYDPALVAEVQTATHGDAVVIDGADHGLELEGDVMQSLDALQRVMRAIQSFLR